MERLLEYGLRKIEKEDISRLKKYYLSMEGNYASSIDLLSIYAWRGNLPAYVKEIHGYLFFIVYDKANYRMVSLPLIGDYGREVFTAAVSEAERIFTELESPLVFTDVTPWMLPFYEACFGERMEIIDSEELAEYIYKMEDFRTYQDRQRERYNYQYFESKNEVCCVEITEKHEAECQQLLKESFCDIHDCEECEYGCQKNTLHHALLAQGEHEVKGILIYADKKPVAYCIVSQEKKQLVFHFKKNLRGYRGLNEYIHRECMDRFGKQMESINYTEDMGVEGLRKYKQNLSPYTLQPKLELRIR